MYNFHTNTEILKTGTLKAQFRTRNEKQIVRSSLNWNCHGVCLLTFTFTVIFSYFEGVLFFCLYLKVIRIMKNMFWHLFETNL